MDINNLLIPHWVNWLAQDSDGAWWGYQVEPLQNHIGWYENEVGQIIKLAKSKANSEWRSTLNKL
jgi:hypothetical protein